MENIAIIGAGTMGSEVALDVACHGYPVILKDVDDCALEIARGKIIQSFRMAKMVKPGLKQVTIEEVLGRIQFVTNYEAFDRQDYIIENIPEDWNAKKMIYRELKEVCSPAVKLFVNTSCISITKIASLTRNPANVIGMHFMNPVSLKELVEVIKGYHTSAETINTAKHFLASLHKKAVVVNDYPGFVANRLSHLFMNEAAFLIQDQVAAPREVDLIFTKGYGHAMGPLATADLIGLDTVVQSLNILYRHYQDSKFRCCPLLVKMVDAGLLGKKSGEGFYKY